MLFVLITSLMVSFLCYSWGFGSFKWINNLAGNKEIAWPHKTIICLLGLAFILVLAGLFSLLVPLGTWYVRLFFFLPSIHFLINQLKNGHIKLSKFYPPLIFFLFFAILLLLLVMSSWAINHPDTLGYHFQIIEWIRKYKIIPGLAHINLRLGLQGLWFPGCAVFDFVVSETNVINLLNFTVVLWFTIFLVDQINSSFKKNGPESLLWLALLGISLWNYTQIRLTITSASPDFIVALLTWAVVYLFLQSTNAVNLTVIAIFAFVAICIKMSSLPIVLFIIYCFYYLIKQEKKKNLLLVIVFGCIIFFAFTARNTITTGYLLYPSPTPDFIKNDWKIDKVIVQNQKNYITAYARTGKDFDAKVATNVARMKMSKWIPMWWRHLSLSDKFIISLLVVCFLTITFFFKKFKKADPYKKIVLLFLFTGIVFWFYFAPDTRFGIGFIVGFIGVTSSIFLLPVLRTLSNKFLIPTLFAIIIVVSVYTAYRFVYFFSPHQIIFPLEIEKSVTKTIVCDGLEIELPKIDSDEYKTINDCEKFSLRGKNLSNGFRAKE